MKKIKLEKKNENDLKRVQRILLNQMERLDDKEIMAERGNKEIKVSGALSQSACSYIKSVQTQIKILDLSNKYGVKVEEMNNYLGIKNETK